MKNPTSIVAFESDSAARTVASRLRDAGFEVAIRFLPTKGAAVSKCEEGYVHRVTVPAVESVRALSWCREFDAAEGLLSLALHCPQCGSLRVDLQPDGDSASLVGGHAAEMVRSATFFCAACRFSWAADICTKSEAKEVHAAA